MKRPASRMLSCLVALAIAPVTTAIADDVDGTCVFVPIAQSAWSFKDDVLRFDADSACDEDYHLPRPLVWKPRQAGQKYIFGIEIPAGHCAGVKTAAHHYEYTTEELGLNEQQREAARAVGESMFSPLTDRQAYIDLLAHAREREAAKEHPNPTLLNLKPCAEPPKPKS